MKLFYIVAALLFAAPGAQADSLYRWVDKAGTMHYGDTPEPDAEEVEELKFSSPATSGADDAALPFETRRAKEHFPVTLYTSANCGEPCADARAFLNKRHIPFSDQVIKTQEDYDKFKHVTGIQNPPVLSVGSTWLRGFSATQWNNELDAAGYPK